MEEKTSLSEKRFQDRTQDWLYLEEDVKEAVKELKEIVNQRPSNYDFQEPYFSRKIKEVFGEELTK